MSLETNETQILCLTNSNSSSGVNNTLRYRLATPLNLRDYEVALAGLQVYYSWPNISPSLGNNTFQYIWIDGSVNTVTFPEGLYTVDDLTGFLSNQMVLNGHYLVDNNGTNQTFIQFISNVVYYRVTLEITPVPSILPAGWSNPAAVVLPVAPLTPQVTILANNLRNNIGFNAGTYPALPQNTTYSTNGQNVPQIADVIAFNVNCNVVTTSFFNSSPSTIYITSPDVGFGQLINIQPRNLNWFKCIDAPFSFIEVQLTDQNNVPLNVLDPTLVITLFFKRRGKLI